MTTEQAGAIPYFDAHCDTIWRNEVGGSLRRSDGHLDLERLKRFRKAAQCFAMYFDMDLVGTPEEMFGVCRRQQAFFRREILAAGNLAEQCSTAEEILRTNGSGRVAAILTCEGAELLNCDPDNLDWAKAAGVKAVNLTHNHANLLAGSHKDQPERGLSDLGRAFMKRAQQLDILIDVSHCSDAAFWDLMEITEKPVIASHSNARSVCPRSRNLTDDMFREIVQTGGVAGINLYAGFVAEGGEEPSLDDLLRHVDRFLALGGAAHIGLGLDLDGCDKLAGGLKGVEDVPALWEALRSRGYGEDLLEDIFYNNYLRVMA